MDAARNVLRETMDRMEDEHVSDWPKIKNEIKSDLSDFVWKETQRKPMILPIIMEV